MTMLQVRNLPRIQDRHPAPFSPPWAYGRVVGPRIQGRATGAGAGSTLPSRRNVPAGSRPGGPVDAAWPTLLDRLRTFDPLGATDPGGRVGGHAGRQHRGGRYLLDSRADGGCRHRVEVQEANGHPGALDTRDAWGVAPGSSLEIRHHSRSSTHDRSGARPTARPPSWTGVDDLGASSPVEPGMAALPLQHAGPTTEGRRPDSRRVTLRRRVNSSNIGLYKRHGDSTRLCAMGRSGDLMTTSGDGTGRRGPDPGDRRPPQQDGGPRWPG